MLFKCLFLVIIYKVSSQSTSEVCPNDLTEPWTYNPRLLNGPNYWGLRTPMCYGEAQSPVNIKTSKVKENKYLQSLSLYNYNVPIARGGIRNNGHTVMITPTDGVNRFFQIDGCTYSLDHFHFHWGGSEHTINNKRYSVEMHLVHRKEDKIAVIGSIFKQSSDDKNGLDPVVKLLKQVPYKNSQYNFTNPINLLNFVDNGCSFYRYIGSLTTPPCTEGVIWTVCKNIKSIGKSQIKKFQKLYSAEEGSQNIDDCRIINNFRPTQDLNGRKIYSST